MRSIRLFLAAVLVFVGMHGERSQAQVCIGDCDGDGRVTVDELMRIPQCTVTDATLVASDQVREAIDNALGGCAAFDSLLVHTEGGLLRGRETDAVRSFLGIPYAAAPIGELRWQRPRSHAGWSGVLRVAAAGSACTQSVPVINVDAGSEDCLFLNVFAPPPPASGPLPVMVWIHGGAFTAGDALGFGSTDGSRIAQQGGVVVVSMNYRLGQLGFLAHPALFDSDAAVVRSSGNYGLFDQIAALQWVQRNIAAFGGDPTNVTLFGESAGGWSVCAHLVSPLSAGLFQRAIVQSGVCALPLPTLAAGELQGERFAQRLGCDDSGDVAACLRGKSLTEVRRTLPPDPRFAFSAGELGQWLPNVDDVLLPDQIATLLAQGSFNRVSVLTGSNRDEGTLFVALSHDFAGSPLSAELYPQRVAHLVPGEGLAAVLERYPLANYGSPGAALSELFGDAFLACPSIDTAELLARHVPVYEYQFEYADAPFVLPPPVPLGAYHSAEIQYVFGQRSGNPFSEIEAALSASMIGYWTRFAATGSPNAATALPWPQRAESGDYLLFDQELATAQHAKQEACAFWRELDYKRSALPEPLELAAQELAVNRAKWAAAGVSHYRMSFQRICNCLERGPAEIIVRDGSIESIRHPQTGEPIPQRDYGTFPFYNSIDEVFAIILEAIELRADRISVVYDPTLGYPIDVVVDYELGVADEESILGIADFVALRDAQ